MDRSTSLPSVSSVWRLAFGCAVVWQGTDEVGSLHRFPAPRQKRLERRLADRTDVPSARLFSSLPCRCVFYDALPFRSASASVHIPAPRPFIKKAKSFKSPLDIPTKVCYN